MKATHRYNNSFRVWNSRRLIKQKCVGSRLAESFTTNAIHSGKEENTYDPTANMSPPQEILTLCPSTD